MKGWGGKIEQKKSWNGEWPIDFGTDVVLEAAADDSGPKKLNAKLTTAAPQ